MRTTIATFLARIAYALAPKGSAVETHLAPIWRPGSK